MTIMFMMIVLFYAHLAGILVYTYFYQRAFTMDISQVTYFCLGRCVFKGVLGSRCIHAHYHQIMSNHPAQPEVVGALSVLPNLG